MIIGTTIMHDGTGTTPYYSPVFSRGGEAAMFSVKVTHVGGNPTLDITIEHKNADDTAWATAGTFTGITAVGIYTDDNTGLKEQLRLKYTFSAGSAGNFVHFTVPAPTWRPY